MYVDPECFFTRCPFPARLRSKVSSVCITSTQLGALRLQRRDLSELTSMDSVDGAL